MDAQNVKGGKQDKLFHLAYCVSLVMVNLGVYCHGVHDYSHLSASHMCADLKDGSGKNYD